MNVPVAFFVFNRPEPTQKVFARIAEARPPVLFVVADGPRPSRPGDVERCAAVRRIVDDVDWPCRVVRLYADSNLGCTARVVSGIETVFDQVEECVFLEDDCLPGRSFFTYAEELLHRYRHDERIMHINGYSYQFGQERTRDSYYFSRALCPWGWASWRRAWQHYDAKVAMWPRLRETDWLQRIVEHPMAVRWWRSNFDLALAGRPVAWSPMWSFAVWSQSGLAITPRDDLIRNIGFGADATLTREKSARFERGPMDLTFPLRHPEGVVPNSAADQFIAQHIAGLQIRLHSPRVLRSMQARLPVAFWRVSAALRRTGAALPRRA